MLARFKDGKVRKVLQFSEGAGIVCDNGENKYVGTLGIDILYLELEDNESGKEFVKEHCWEQARVDAAIAVMPKMLDWLTAGGTISQDAIENNRAARNAVFFADALIAELKKKGE